MLRNSGSAPSLPPLPPLLAPSRGAGPVRSRSVVAIHDSKGHAEAFQPLQRGTPHMFRTAPLPISPEGVGVASQSPLPPSLVPPPQQPPQPPTQRPGPRDDSCVVRLAQKLLPAAVAGQADNRHWRDSGINRTEVSAVREGWGDARDADARLTTARLSVV